eukprot:3846458-Prymnesium_polylepis.1
MHAPGKYPRNVPISTLQQVLEFGPSLLGRTEGLAYVFRHAAHRRSLVARPAAARTRRSSHNPHAPIQKEAQALAPPR